MLVAQDQATYRRRFLDTKFKTLISRMKMVIIHNAKRKAVLGDGTLVLASVLAPPRGQAPGVRNP